SHRADRKHFRLDFDKSKAGYAIQIDDVVGRGEPHVEHRHERLAAGEQPRVVEPPKQRERLRQRLRIVVGEARRLHSGRMPACRMTSRKRATSALMIAAISRADFGNRSMPAAAMRLATSGLRMTFRRS